MSILAATKQYTYEDLVNLPLSQLTAIHSSFAVTKSGAKISKKVQDRISHVIEPRCPHGNEAGECNDCLVQSDFAADVAREDRIFGR
jgi:hypothetical protein